MEINRKVTNCPTLISPELITQPPAETRSPNEIPATIKEMDLMSVKENEASIPIAYTVWSFKKGAGKKIMKELQKYIKSKDQFESIITLSPLTPVATHYHIRNGARLIKINPTTQNFEYKI